MSRAEGLEDGAVVEGGGRLEVEEGEGERFEGVAGRPFMEREGRARVRVWVIY